KQWLARGTCLLNRIREVYRNACRERGTTPERAGGVDDWEYRDSLEYLIKQGEAVSTTARATDFGEEVAGLQDLVLFGLKGAAAYADHAQILGYEKPEVFSAFHETLDLLARNESSAEVLFRGAMRVGALNYLAMELLDAANTGTYGHPEPTSVRVTPVRGKAIVVSGHDLKDLEELLKQTQDLGINIYTHGEMLPAHGYPGLRKFAHLVGNYGGAWQDQVREFDVFPGAVLMTTNCLQRPRESYKGRIFSSGLVAWPGVRHITDRNFAPVIEAALAASGFTEDAPEKRIMVGFGRRSVLNVADKVIGLIKRGKIKRIFLIGGCDGAKPGRSYYTDFAQKVPPDCLIMTLACGKYRFNKLEFGEIEGLPRLLDVGQCNDAYSVIQIALAVARTLGCSVNELPVSLVLSWYEQKAVAILLTLLQLGIRNIRIGPSAPAFVRPAVWKKLADEFGLRPITTPEADLAAILGA
ncbi:MAG: hydroxylamine reductase, partial [Kiritimatiellae bacterium]|nr:hydroxylamine reductase [Kiritimatiellia bacterium]